MVTIKKKHQEVSGITKIDENAFYFDQAKMAALAANYNSIEDMLLKEFNMKIDTHYNFTKEPGKMSIWAAALTGRKIPACRLLNAVDAVFVRPGSLMKYLRPDADGTTYKPKFKDSKPVPSGGVVTPATSPTPQPTPAAPPATPDTTSGAASAKKGLENTEDFNTGGYKVEVKFLEKKGEEYILEVSGGERKFKAGIDAIDIDGKDKSDIRRNLARKVIIPNSKAIYGIDFPVYMKVRGISFEVVLSPECLMKDESKAEFRVKSMESSFKVPHFYVEIKSFKNAEKELEKVIDTTLVVLGYVPDSPGKSISDKKVKDLKQKSSPRARRLYGMIADTILSYYNLNPKEERKETDYDFDSVFIIRELKGGSEVISVELHIIDLNTDYSRKERNEVEQRILNRYKGKLRGSNFQRGGLNRFNQTFVIFEFDDEKLIEYLIKQYKLDEMFGFWVAKSRINEATELEELGKRSFLEKYFPNLEGVDYYELEKKDKKCYEVYFVFYPEISPEKLQENINNHGITVIYDEISDMYIGLSTIEVA